VGGGNSVNFRGVLSEFIYLPLQAVDGLALSQNLLTNTQCLISAHDRRSVTCCPKLQK